MIYAETEDGIRFGGFNSEGFSSSDDYAASFKAFLYCWPKGSETPVVLNKAWIAQQLPKDPQFSTDFNASQRMIQVTG